ncbi:MAG: ornithine cyclodeaminase [Candidatus Fimenecus sp.]
MKLIGFEEIVNMHIEPQTVYNWVSEMILHKNETVLPHKISMKHDDLPGVFCNVMPSFVTVGGKLYGGVKVVTRYPERQPALDSQLILFDGVSGEFLALMDANWITAVRTGAVAAHSIQLLSKKDSKVIGMMGLGNVARTSMLYTAEVFKDRDFDVKLLKYQGEEELFAKRFEKYSNLHFTYVDTAEEMVDGSDIVLSAATYLPNNVCADKYFKEGILVVPVHTLGFTNCDLFFDKVFADDTAHVEGFRYFDKFKSFAEVADVVNGKAPGRENDKERILAYNIGLSIHDVNLAARIYETIKKDTLQDIAMNPPTERLWV